jgi:hypothetical protein
MTIDQRNNGATVTVSAAYTLDRWEAYENTSGSMTIGQSTVAPTGFRNSLLVTITGTAPSLGTNIALIRQYIEGYNVADLMWGTANAQSVTLSFWVRSSVTGTFTGVLQNANSDRAYAYSYTISSANTWEQKTVTLPGDTTGTWNTTNGRGIDLVFSLASASGLTANTWQANGTGGNYYYAATGQTNLFATSGATWQITGVQLEKGNVATSFDVLPYGTELMLCQRYYQMGAKGADGSAGSGSPYTAGGGMFVPWKFTVEMRTAPSIVSSASDSFRARKGDLTVFAGFIAYNGVTNTSGTLITASVSGSTVGSYYWLEGNTSAALLAFSAEL